MQIPVIVFGCVLCAIEFLCIYLKTSKPDKNLWSHVKQVVLPGAITGIMVSLIILKPITTLDVAVMGLFGVMTGETIYIFYLTAESIGKIQKETAYYDDNIPKRFFITGDKHREFGQVKSFCLDVNTSKKDVLIILGDAGFNYYEDDRDDKLKREISRLHVTLFCLHGNKEKRPQNVGTYGLRNFCGGRVYYEPKYPNILFAIDGEIYTFEERKYMVVGGAHSVDKMDCLEENKPFWEDEMPDDATKNKVESKLRSENNAIFGMMTHTCPVDYIPTEMFISARRNEDVKRRPKKVNSDKIFKPDIDRSTEEWLAKIEKRINYEVWYCGHYHVDKQIDKINMMYQEIRPLHMQLMGEKS